MKRLTERNNDGSGGYKIQAKNLDSHCVAKDKRGYVTYYGQHIDKLAEYEDAEEQGLLLRFPCKVGDTVYVDSRTIPTKNMDFEEAKEVQLYFRARVVSFRQNCNGNYIKLAVKAKWLHEWVDPDTGPDSAYFEIEKYFTYPLSSIGKTVFLTKAEAEQKLKEMEDK